MYVCVEYREHILCVDASPALFTVNTIVTPFESGGLVMSRPPRPFVTTLAILSGLTMATRASEPMGAAVFRNFPVLSVFSNLKLNPSLPVRLHNLMAGISMNQDDVDILVDAPPLRLLSISWKVTTIYKAVMLVAFHIRWIHPLPAVVT